MGPGCCHDDGGTTPPLSGGGEQLRGRQTTWSLVKVFRDTCTRGGWPAFFLVPGGRGRVAGPRGRRPWLGGASVPPSQGRRPPRPRYASLCALDKSRDSLFFVTVDFFASQSGALVFRRRFRKGKVMGARVDRRLSTIVHFQRKDSSEYVIFKWVCLCGLCRGAGCSGLGYSRDSDGI